MRLGKNQAHLLVSLDRADKPMQAPDLSSCIMTVEVAGPTLKKLESKGLVQRVGFKTKGAYCYWTDYWRITPAGRAAVGGPAE